MWNWMLQAYGAFIILGGVGALLVALLVPEDQPDRRKTAFAILKLVLGAGTGIAAVATVAIKLAEAGLL